MKYLFVSSIWTVGQTPRPATLIRTRSAPVNTSASKSHLVCAAAKPDSASSKVSQPAFGLVDKSNNASRLNTVNNSNNNTNTLVVAENLVKSYDGERVQLNGISFQIPQGAKVGVVGNNGTGKSTLLRILAGKEFADSGSYWFKKGMSIAFVEQQPSFEDEWTVLDAIYKSDTQVIRVLKEYEGVLEQVEEAAKDSNTDPSVMEKLSAQLSKATSKMDSARAWDLDSFVRKVLSALGLYHLDRKMKDLSGGEKQRVNIASALIQKPDIIILDEPTNQLDIMNIQELQNALLDPNLTVVCVTHDRVFLDEVCNQIYELDRGQLFVHDGNFQKFLENKDLRESTEEKLAQDARVRLRRELEWMRKQPRARQAKSKSRIESFYELEKVAKGRSQRSDLKLSVQVSRIGGKILEMADANKAFGDQIILKDFTYDFTKGDRIGIVGPSGVGKTTFLRILTQQLALDSGFVELGETVKFSYYDQKGITIPEDKRVIEYITETLQRAGNTTMTALNMLERFQFEKSQQYTFIDRLSGGERRRLQLMSVLCENPNFLCWDEPTNDLDLSTLEILEDFLTEFPGVLVVISHDRMFMDRLTKHLFVFEGQGVVKHFSGTFSEYLTLTREKAMEAEQEEKKLKAAESASWTDSNIIQTATISKTADKSGKKKLSYNENKEYSRIEGEIEKLQMKRDALNKKLLDSKLGYSELTEMTAELGELEKQIDTKTARWFELAERAGE